MEAHSVPAAAWLTRPADIAAHLAVVAAEAYPAALSGPGFSTRGQLGAPAGGWVVFVPAPEGLVQFPRIGATVRVEYQGTSDGYTFYSKLVSIDANGSWILHPPLTIERTDRRIVARHLVSGQTGFCARVTEWSEQPLLGIHDISAGGVGMLVDPRRYPVAVGDLLEVVLHLPGETSFPACVEVVNLRPVPRSHLHVAGTRITAIASEHQARLAEFLAAWSRRRGGPAPSER